MASPVEEALTHAWDVLGDRQSLLPDLDIDAVVARADAGELEMATPRLLELAVHGRIGRESLHGLIGRVQPLLVERGPGREAVIDVLDAWWAQTIALDPVDDDPASMRARTVLGALAHLDEPLVRWFEPWLIDLDGPQARHLADLVTDGLSGSAWDEVPDKRQQVLGWAASEPVVFGLTLVGGMHLADGELSDVLDRLLEGS